MKLPIYQIDAFTDKPFHGNPAAVVPLSEWLPNETLQKIAMENNLSETAFFVADGEKFHLRWFTPTTEVDLCGHATLATSFAIFEELGYDKDTIHFTGLSGDLYITKTDNGMTMDFPLWPYETVENDAAISEALGAKPESIYSGYDWVALYDDENTVRNLTPDFEKLGKIGKMRGIIATAKSDGEHDFISRAFFPAIGIHEDPVTGSAHCILAPFWKERLNKSEFFAHQASARGGDLHLKINGDRLEITGQACLFMKGEIHI